MIVAITNDNGKVSGHFGHCEGFAIYEIEGTDIMSRSYIENPGHRPGFLPNFLADNNVNVIISGGMGHRAKQIFQSRNVEVIVGIEGHVEDVINDYLNNSLKINEELANNHHGHHNHSHHHHHDHDENCNCGSEEHNHEHNHDHGCNCH